MCSLSLALSRWATEPKNDATTAEWRENMVRQKFNIPGDTCFSIVTHSIFQSGNHLMCTKFFFHTYGKNIYVYKCIHFWFDPVSGLIKKTYISYAFKWDFSYWSPSKRTWWIQTHRIEFSTNRRKYIWKTTAKRIEFVKKKTTFYCARLQNSSVLLLLWLLMMLDRYDCVLSFFPSKRFIFQIVWIYV